MSDLDGLLFKKVMVAGQPALRPSDIHSDEWLAGMKEGAEVMMTGRRPRNPKFHRLFFGLLRLVRSNDPEERWQSEEALLSDLKLAAGHYDVAVNILTGQQELRPKSISFASMAEDEFKRFFMRAVHILTTKVLIGTAPQEIIDEVFKMAEGKAAMTLCQAISILARVHTRQASDDPTDFCIEVGATGDSFRNGVTPNEWQNAWRVVRENAGMQPEDQKD